MPTIDIQEFQKLPPLDLEAMRNAIIKKADGNHENLEIEDLQRLAAITGVLRRRVSGPPKAAKEKGSSRTKAFKATIDDLA